MSNVRVFEKERKMQILEKCRLCPHECGVNRLKNEIGRCKATAEVKIALADLHYYEEPCISGENGSGAVFFTGCNMNCVFCQNYEISQLNKGKIVSIEELANELINLQNKGANNINLVTACIYVPQVIEAIKIAKNNGLIIPIVYNSSGYEKVETLKMLEGYVDVYLPDLKYFYNDLAKELSGINNYFEIATDAINEMYRQVRNPVLDENGIIQKGLIIRHLILPNHLQNTKQVLKWIYKNLGKETFVSIMAQYFPEYNALKCNDINRKLNREEYKKAEEFVNEIGFINGYMQDLEDDEKKYVPKWNI